MTQCLFPFALLLCVASASASEPGEATEASCASSFPVRVAAAKSAVVSALDYADEYKRGMPWFEAHCRFLSPLEIAVRKLNDPNSFVCDTAKGRPAGLTTAYVMTHQIAPSSPAVFLPEDDSTGSKDRACLNADGSSRVALDLNSEDPLVMLRILCWGKTSKACEKALTPL